MLEAEQKKSELELQEKERERQAMLEEKEKNRELKLERLKFESEQRKMEFEDRKMQIELESLRLEQGADRSAGEGGEANQPGGARVISEEIRSPDLPRFVDGKDDLDSYLLRFERYATVANWPQTKWANQLSVLLGGKALDVYSKLSQGML